MELGFDEVMRIMEEIRNRTTVPAYSLVVVPDKEPGLFDSKFGGLPYWDMDKEYPKDADGNPLMLLAQLNFDRMEVEDALPDKGILQFYIRPDEMFGVDLDHPDVQDTFRVIYHETVDYDVSREAVENLHVPDSSQEEFTDCSPTQRELAIECVGDTSFMGLCDYRFEQMFKDVAKELLDVDFGEGSIYEAIDDEVMDEIEEELEEEEAGSGHRMLGYPHFTQIDPREYNEEYRIYDTLLFQMDTDRASDEGRDYFVIWGDCGVGNFLINQKDLEKRDFSKVLYNWDCC